MPRSGFRRVSCFAALFLAAPILCLPAAIEVNGATCEVGSCASPGTLSPGQSIASQNFSFYYTLPNTDEFLINGTYSASGNAPSIAFEAIATFEGNSTHTTASADTISVDLLQNFAYNGSPDGTYSESATLSQSNVPPGSYVTAELSFGGQGIGLLGPFTGSGSQTFSDSKDLTGLSNPSLADFNYTFVLTAGETAVPEPAGLAWVGLGALALAVLLLRRRAAAGI